VLRIGGKEFLGQSMPTVFRNTKNVKTSLSERKGKPEESCLEDTIVIQISAKVIEWNSIDNVKSCFVEELTDIFLIRYHVLYREGQFYKQEIGWLKSLLSDSNAQRHFDAVDMVDFWQLLLQNSVDIIHSIQ
jgi:hypothetical protein